MSVKIRLRRGAYGSLPTSGLSAGEPLWSSDRGTIHVASDGTTVMPLVPAIDDLNALGSIDGANDYFIIHDASEASGQKEKRLTPSTLKTWLNIPSNSTDEKVAVNANGTAGYIWGTDGTDGIFRMGDGLSWTKDGGDAFVTQALDLNTSNTFTGDGAGTPLDLASGAITGGMLDSNALSLSSTFSGDGISVNLDIATGAVKNSMLDNSALNLSSDFSGNGISTPLEIAEVDGGQF